MLGLHLPVFVSIAGHHRGTEGTEGCSMFSVSVEMAHHRVAEGAEGFSASAALRLFYAVWLGCTTA